jgi:ribonuclease E
MAKHMLIDATHPEETRVAVVDGHRLEEFDFEIAAKKPLKGNIYLAKVTRVEPSLQAAFVDYGGNRHGFLAFSEIHPDYYRIPIADREALLAELDREDGEAEREPDRDLDTGRQEALTPEIEEPQLEPAERDTTAASAEPLVTSVGDEPVASEVSESSPLIITESSREEREYPTQRDVLPLASDVGWSVSSEPISLFEPAQVASPAEQERPAASAEATDAAAEQTIAEVSPVTEITEIGEESVAPPSDVGAADDLEEGRRRRARQIRRYKIQEVVKRRQIMLVQVTKEERGNKGAALTTYLSLAGRYCVLMPNTPRGGGISRKITNPGDRKRLKSIIDELEIPEGIAVIVRTAGSERSRAEIKRDYEYLLRLWDEIRELTLRSTAPTLVYEEANLIKRSIRDLYSKDIEDVLVEGEEGYKTAKSFMKMLTPSHAKRVQLYKDPTVPLFPRYQVEAQIDAIHQPVVQLKSGGYMVLNQTEALVAIDINSGRATRERHIEETALKTNLEAADEIARQLRLRDLAGLIVIDFIDMEDQRHNNQVERRLKEALKSDRARIQMGRISHFGLLEMSRQRLRPSLIETSTVVCRHCGGTGHVRSTESTALHLLRAFEEEGIRKRSSEITVSAPTAVTLYILNQKRQALTQIEQRYGLHILLAADDNLIPPDFRMERTRLRSPEDDRQQQPISPDVRHIDAPEPDEAEEADAVEEAAEEEASEPRVEDAEDGEERKRRRSRRRRRRRGEEAGEQRVEGRRSTSRAATLAEPIDSEQGESPAPTAGESVTSAQNGARKRRRRGKRGGRRRRHGETSPVEAAPTLTGESENATPADDHYTEADGRPFVGSHEPEHSEAEPTELVSNAVAGPWSEPHLPAVADHQASPQPERPIPAEQNSDAGSIDLSAPEPLRQTPETTAVEPRGQSVAQPQEQVKERPRRKGWWQRVIE